LKKPIKKWKNRRIFRENLGFLGQKRLKNGQICLKICIKKQKKYAIAHIRLAKSGKKLGLTKTDRWCSGTYNWYFIFMNKTYKGCLKKFIFILKSIFETKKVILMISMMRSNRKTLLLQFPSKELIRSVWVDLVWLEYMMREKMRSKTSWCVDVFFFFFLTRSKKNTTLSCLKKALMI